MIESRDGRRLWQHEITKIGLQHPFVLWGMLSLASLHYAYLNPSERETSWVDATVYHNKAIDGFREASAHVGSDFDWDTDGIGTAFFVSSMLNVPYVFFVYNQQHDAADISTEEHSNRISRTLGAEWIPIMRGMKYILPPVHESLKTGPLAEIVNVPNWAAFKIEDQPSTEDDDRLLRLRETWNTSNEADISIYEDSLQVLRRCCAWANHFTAIRKTGVLLEGYNHEWSAPFMWVHMAPEEYFTLLQQRQAPALLLFAYFGALLHQLDHYWWIKGWGKNVVSAVDELLGTYWQPWLEYPKQAVSTT